MISNQATPMTLYLDGNQIEEPDGTAITNAFESIDKRTDFHGGAVSLVELSRSKGNSLAVSGHPVEGWFGLIHEAGGVSRAADISSPLRQEKVIQIFQAYAQGDGLWEKEFQWDIIDSGKWPVKRIAILMAILAGILVVCRSCVK